MENEENSKKFRIYLTEENRAKVSKKNIDSLFHESGHHLAEGGTYATGEYRQFNNEEDMKKYILLLNSEGIDYHFTAEKLGKRTAFERALFGD